MAKFKMGDVLMHLDTGRMIKILNTPDNIRLQRTNEKGYLYKDSDSDLLKVSPQRDIEDGRYNTFG